ncbi:hypothetical protein AK830_g146 [Neonectria ditissima]|uniref:L-rhamnose-1-dehydrogenase n=1 Tax=Neonectria ditissima TaxID=78410 RepID=A0A0P7B7V8_9HYPO|nr:hypothetical protein AK830_g146 [Neonectria ditissima]
MSAAVRLLAGKTAAITGGTTGIGRAITLEYLRQGANVAVNHLGLSKDEPLRQSLLEEARRFSREAPEGAPTGELLEVAGDVTNPQTGENLVAQAVEKWGALDVFVANAGIFKPSKFLEIDQQMFDTSMQVNVNGAFYACQAAARQMVKQGKGGSIIGISSISALVGGGLQVHYTPTKAALLSMTQSMAISLAKDKIRVNALLPGTIHTQLADEDMANEEKRKYLEHRIPWGRVGKPEDLAGPAVFLAADQMSGFVTGAQLLVDGGICLLALEFTFTFRFSDFDPHPEMDEPRRFTRGRTTRGKGLRKTTGCQPSGQVNGGNGNGSSSSDTAEPTLPSPGSSPRHAQAPADTEEPSAIPAIPAIPNTYTSLNAQSGYVLQDDSGIQADEVTNVGMSNPESQPVSYCVAETPRNLGPQDCSSAGSFPHLQPVVYEITSPTNVSFHHAPLPYAATPDSGVSHGAESLTSRWLHLLIGDASLNWGPLPELDFDLNGYDIFGNSVAQTPVALDENGTPQADDRQRTDNLDTQIGKLPMTSHSPYLQERILFAGDQLRATEQAWQALEPIVLQQQEHILFRHFIDHISHWLHNVGLMNAILALSARHLCIVSSDVPSCAARLRPDPNDAIGYYYKTLHYSQKAMQYDTYQTSLELLASAIIISSYEMLDGSSTDWEKHLKGVFWIQRSQVIHGDSGGLRQAVWWAWICQDVWAAFREKRKPFTFWKPTRALADLSPCELAARAVYNFAHVVGFCAEWGVSKDGRHAATKTEEADRIMQQLQQWKSYLTVEFKPLPMAASSDARNEPFPLVWIQPSAFGQQTPNVNDMDVWLTRNRSINATLLLLADTTTSTSALLRQLQRVSRKTAEPEEMGKHRVRHCTSLH